MNESRKLLFLIFGAILAAQWFFFVVMVGLDLSQPRELRVTPPEPVAMNRTMLQACFTPTCLEHVAQRLARVYPNRTDGHWCIASGHKKDAQDRWQGLILVKVPKVASSTAAGVTLRIADQSHAHRRRPCESVQWRHHPATFYTNRSRTKSFVWTTIRDPAERAISTIFFHNISRRRPERQIHVPDEDIMEQLRHSVDAQSGATSQGKAGFQLQYMAFREIAPWQFYNASRPRLVRFPNALHRLVLETLRNYDFVAVVDRMDESLVALSLLLGVPVSDVLVTSSKVAGQSYNFVHLPKQQFKCLPTVPSYVRPRVQRFLASDTYRAANWGDYLLHKAASISLDRTIAALGHDRFERALAKYRQLRELEELHCAPFVQFPCSNKGVPQPDVSAESCYLPFYDFGCGHKCIDDMLARQAIVHH